MKFKIFSIKRYFRYIKLILKWNIILTIIISSSISNLIIKLQEIKYQNLFKDGQELEITAIVVSNKEEKEYYNRYKIKTASNENLYVSVNKKEETYVPLFYYVFKPSRSESFLLAYL